ncbi:hypothetical protein Tcan_05658 [Toxocara canis]|uniref:Uncharacterized protein n=1 Tax=Toxocara canis TaxID=6265 RepID=A0A0B2VBM1_TOXCA|nr:hypothetical protein Tcan_05658 [Toxocara canis]
MKHEQHHHHHHYHYHHHHYHQHHQFWHHQCQQQEQHVHVWGTLLAFWQLFQSAQALYHITAERPISLLMETCSHERKPLTDNTMLFFPEKVKFCTTLFTSKRKAHYEKDVKRTANLHTVVKISWRDVDSAQMCTLHYKFRFSFLSLLKCQF